MIRSRGLVLLVAVIAAVAWAAAGEPGKKKCPMKTQDCLDAMAVKMKTVGWVGVEFDAEDPAGFKVTNVIPKSPAATAGIQVGDVLWELEGVRLQEGNDAALKSVRKDWFPGRTVTYTIRRDGVARPISLTLAAWPADIIARQVGEHMLAHVTGDTDATKAN